MDCIPILFNPNTKRKKKKSHPLALPPGPLRSPAPAPGPKPTLQPGPPGARRPEPTAALRNRAPVPRGHLHPAVGRLLRAWPLAKAGLGSVCPRSGHRQLHLRLPLHAPGGSAGPELRRLLLRLAAFRHPPAPPSPPGAGRPATGHLPLGLGADSRDRRARAGPAPRVRVCVRVGPEPGFGFGSTTAPTQVMAPASAPAPASRRPLARSHARAPIPRSLGPSVPRSLTTRRPCEEGDGPGSQFGEGCLFGRRRSARPQRADWSGSSVPPLWQRREGGERERREGGRNLDVWDSGRPRERRLW